MATTTSTNSKYRFAANCWAIAALLWCIGGLLGGNVGLFIPIGMMNVCIAMMYHAKGRPNGDQRANEPPKEES